VEENTGQNEQDTVKETNKSGSRQKVGPGASKVQPDSQATQQPILAPIE